MQAIPLGTLFTVCNVSVLPFWLLLVLAPRARVTQILVHSPVVPVFLGLAYTLGLLTLGPSPEGASFSSLSGVSKFFALPQGVLVGWIHYLIFDLFVGAWEARDAERLGISRLLLLPCLLLTFLLGPIGLLLYVCLRYGTTRSFGFSENLQP